MAGSVIVSTASTLLDNTTGYTLSTVDANSYQVYTLNKTAVIGIVAGICGGIPVLVICCCCLCACLSKKSTSKQVESVENVTPNKNALLQKFCDMKEKTITHFKTFSSEEGRLSKKERRKANMKSKSKSKRVAVEDSNDDLTKVKDLASFVEENERTQQRGKKTKAQKKKKNKKDKSAEVEEQSARSKNKKDKKKKKEKKPAFELLSISSTHKTEEETGDGTSADKPEIEGKSNARKNRNKKKVQKV